MTELENKIYSIVRNIPKGKVATYSSIAKMCGNKNLARFIGNAMHKNPLPFYQLAQNCGLKNAKAFCDFSIFNFDPVPCHRVVNAKGKMGKNFALGGVKMQEKMLKEEGVEIINGIVDLEKYSVFN